MRPSILDRYDITRVPDNTEEELRYTNDANWETRPRKKDSVSFQILSNLASFWEIYNTANWGTDHRNIECAILSGWTSEVFVCLRIMRGIRSESLQKWGMFSIQDTADFYCGLLWSALLTKILSNYPLKGVVRSIQNWIGFETVCCSNISLKQIHTCYCYMAIDLVSATCQSPIKKLIANNSHLEKSKMPKFRCLISLAIHPTSMMHMAHSICTILIGKRKPQNYI